MAAGGGSKTGNPNLQLSIVHYLLTITYLGLAV